MLMKTMKLFYALLLTGSLAGLAACTDKEEIEGDGHGFDEATFSVTATNVGNTEATFTLSQTGNAEATYYGFLSDDLSSKASDLIAAEISSLSVTRHILMKGTNEVSVKGLRQGGRNYRYIVTGLLANGTTYNEPVEAVIETTGNYTTGTLAVSVAGIAAQTPTFSISGVDGLAAYAVLEKEVAAGFASEKVLFNALFDEIDNLAVINADQDNCKWSKLEPGDYVVYALGLNEDETALEGFQPTLNYAKAEFTVEEVLDPEQEYLAYIGTWYDADGNEYTLTQKDVNASYTMTGLDADITVLYENKGIKFSGEEALGTTTDGLPIYLFGIDADGYAEDASQNDADPYILATGALADGKIAVTGSEYEAVYSGTTYEEVIVGLVVYSYDEAEGKLYSLAETPTVLQLPASLSKEKPGDQPGDDTYSKYLGNWTITRGSVTDTWTISVKEEGVSYNIDGVEGFSADDGMTIEAKFENDNLVIYTQTLGTWTHSSYGTVEDNLYGNIIANDTKYRITGTYVAATGTISADGQTIELTPGKVNIASLGGEFDIAGIQFYGVLTDEGENQGKALYYNADYTTLPNTLTKVGGNETGPYTLFLGDWTITRGSVTDTWTISVKEEGVSYNIDGVEGFSADDGMTIEAKFENDNLVIYTQTLGTWTHSSYGTVEDNLYGNIIANDTKYRITGTYVAATGTISADGQTIELTPGKVNIASLGGEFDIAGIQFYGVLTDEGENQGKALYYNADYTTLPNTLTAATAGGSSVRIDKQASARIGGLALNAGSTARRTFASHGEKSNGQLEKASGVKAERKDKSAAPQTRGSKVSRESKSSSILAGHKA